MLRFYAVPGTSMFEVDETDKGPDQGWIEMQAERPQTEDSMDYTAQADGTWAITSETLQAKLVPVELEWRAASLAMIARQLEALEEVEDGFPPTDLKTGTRAQWRQFRGLVSNWNEANGDFPDSSKRPVAPS